MSAPTQQVVLSAAYFALLKARLPSRLAGRDAISKAADPRRRARHFDPSGAPFGRGRLIDILARARTRGLIDRALLRLTR
jgi:hypothetical protein